MNENERLRKKNKEFADMLEDALVATFNRMTPEELQKVQSYMVNSDLQSIIKKMEESVINRKKNSQPKG